MGAPALGIKVTMTAGSGFPSGSTTLPKMFPVLICELREIVAVSKKNATKILRKIRLLLILFLMRS
jgi:hypothetical protein